MLEWVSDAVLVVALLTQQFEDESVLNVLRDCLEVLNEGGVTRGGREGCVLVLWVVELICFQYACPGVVVSVG